VVGKPQDYKPSTEDEKLLSAKLKNSMLERRRFAWTVVEQLLFQTQVKLPEADAEVSIPLWQTWYEGRLADSPELEGLFIDYFGTLKLFPNWSRADAAEHALKQPKSLTSSLTDKAFGSVLGQFQKDLSGMPGFLGGTGFTLFSPSFVTHVMQNAEAIEKCEGKNSPDDPPPSDTNFSHCIPEFPRSAVMVKSVWRPLNEGVPQHQSDSAAMAKLIEEGTWPTAKTTKHPTRAEIYTSVSKQGTPWGLRAIHIVTKDVREWVWITLWWDADAKKDFGADVPDSIGRFNGGVWKNYKMCVTTSFEEGDPQPWIHYSGPQASLADSLEATYKAIQQQIRDGGKQVLDKQFNPPKFTARSLGPWQAPYDKPTTWCSNPNIESSTGNGRTSCIGCHQGAFTWDDARDDRLDFHHLIGGDQPQFARAQYRKNFPSDFAWSFDFEFQNIIKQARTQEKFEWEKK
jgi:hypothetical protein